MGRESKPGVRTWYPNEDLRERHLLLGDEQGLSAQSHLQNLDHFVPWGIAYPKKLTDVSYFFCMFMPTQPNTVLYWPLLGT